MIIQKQKLRDKYVRDNISVLCPRCYAYSKLGSVECVTTVSGPAKKRDNNTKVVINASNCFRSEKAIESSDYPIEVYCTNHPIGEDVRMIATDSSMAPLLSEMCKNGLFYLEASNQDWANDPDCNCPDSTSASITFRDVLPDFVIRDIRSHMTKICDAIVNLPGLAQDGYGWSIPDGPRRIYFYDNFFESIKKHNVLEFATGAHRTVLIGGPESRHWSDYAKRINFDPKDMEELAMSNLGDVTCSTIVPIVIRSFLDSPSKESKAFMDLQKAKYGDLEHYMQMN